MNFIKTIIFGFGILLNINAYAQKNCDEDFSQISTDCIVGYADKSKYKQFNLTVTNELKGNTYFYQTPNGQIGKIKIISALVNKRECIVYLEGTTFGTKVPFSPNSSLAIGIEKSNWIRDSIYLDKEGYSSLELHREKGKCELKSSKDTNFIFYKKYDDNVLFEEENFLLKYTPFVLLFIAIFIIARSILEDQDKFKTQETLEDADTSRINTAPPLYLKITRPFYKRYFLPIVENLKNRSKIKTKYKQKLANAGLSKMINPEELFALKLFMILGAPFLFLTIRQFLEEDWPLTLAPVMGVVGFFYPDIWVSGVISKRKDEVIRSMPFIVDMLALSVEAGLDFMAAIQRVIEKAPPSSLVEEFETLIRETRIGSTRAEGLRQLSWRINVIEINSFCATLIAADSVGASIGPILKQLSNEMRVKRSARAEQLGATAATKILIPMIFFIMPAVLIAVFAPMIMDLFT